MGDGLFLPSASIDISSNPDDFYELEASLALGFEESDAVQLRKWQKATIKLMDKGVNKRVVKTIWKVTSADEMQ